MILIIIAITIISHTNNNVVTIIRLIIIMVIITTGPSVHRTPVCLPASLASLPASLSARWLQSINSEPPTPTRAPDNQFRKMQD